MWCMLRASTMELPKAIWRLFNLLGIEGQNYVWTNIKGMIWGILHNWGIGRWLIITGGKNTRL